MNKRITGAVGTIQGNLLKVALLNHGVDLMGAEGSFLSYTHTEKEINKTLEAFDGALWDLQKEGIL